MNGLRYDQHTLQQLHYAYQEVGFLDIKNLVTMSYKEILDCLVDTYDRRF